MSGKREMNQLVTRLARAGWRIVVAGSGHLKAYPPDGGRFVTLSKTPSAGRSRAMTNTRAALRRAGFEANA